MSNLSHFINALPTLHPVHKISALFAIVPLFINRQKFMEFG